MPNFILKDLLMLLANDLSCLFHRRWLVSHHPDKIQQRTNISRKDQENALTIIQDYGKVFMFNNGDEVSLP